ncbi:MAG: hypothetical protein WC869_06670 [Phycisphaerae bacterium]
MKISAWKVAGPAAVLAVAAIVLLSGAGCQGLGYMGYLLAPETSQKSIEPELAEMDNHRVAIILYADQRALYEYPYLRLTLASAIKGELTQRLKGVVVVDPARVSRYQEEHINWDSDDKTVLGKALGADYILYVSLVEYTTREPGSVNLYRGRIIAECSVYKTSLPEREAKVWQGETISVLYPIDSTNGVPAENDRDIRQATEKLLAEALAKKFYKHKAPKEDDGHITTR